MQLKRKAPMGEPRSWGRPQKNSIEPYVETCDEPPKELPNKILIKVDNNIKEQEVAMSLNETHSKIHKLKSLNKVINNPIHGHH